MRWTASRPVARDERRYGYTSSVNDGLVRVDVFTGSGRGGGARRRSTRLLAVWVVAALSVAGATPSPALASSPAAAQLGC